VDASEIEALKASLEMAEKISEKAARRSAKAKAKVKDAAQTVEELGLKTEKNEKDPSESADSQ
jgi:exonuclease VII small subunit